MDGNEKKDKKFQFFEKIFQRRKTTER